jgi:hypothetical protein
MKPRVGPGRVDCADAHAPYFPAMSAVAEYALASEAEAGTACLGSRQALPATDALGSFVADIPSCRRTYRIRGDGDRWRLTRSDTKENGSVSLTHWREMRQGHILHRSLLVLEDDAEGVVTGLVMELRRRVRWFHDGRPGFSPRSPGLRRLAEDAGFAYVQAVEAYVSGLERLRLLCGEAGLSGVPIAHCDWHMIGLRHLAAGTTGRRIRLSDFMPG